MFLLENIGFYTLSDNRCRNVSWSSDLQRCELILTDRCNFKCPYCRGIVPELVGDLTLDQAKEIVSIWVSGNLHNIRFSGGEPTVWEPLLDLVKFTRSHECFEHIAVSTNGSADIEFYKTLHEAGVNDFSISLDACCASKANAMAGTDSRFHHIIDVIRELSSITYVTVGVVLNEQNRSDLKQIIEYAKQLGVSDIRIIPSAQSNHILQIEDNTELQILKYRLDNIKNGRHVRGLTKSDCHKCHLVKDDMVVLKGKHFPCVIYMREQGNYIGDVFGKSLDQIRQERNVWFDSVDIHNDPICNKNCLDVCIDHNNRCEYYM
jgi:MoaA/NifB/PqqE/SkfB family radical SAM enzyme